MSRRRFLKTVALVGAGAMAGGLGVQRGAFVQQTPPRSATKRPIRILMGATIAAGMNCRVLGYFEAGFSQLSNALRPVHAPADMKGMRIRVRPSKVQARTFELLGAKPKAMDLSEFIEAIKAGAVDAQE